MRDANFAFPMDVNGADSERQPLVVLTDVGKSFDEISVLRHIDLEIVPGEIHALMGENGAGKSTLVKVLSGVIKISDGVIRVGGEPVLFKIRGKRRVPALSLSIRN